LRLVDSDILPFEFGAFTKTVSEYVTEIEKEAAQKGHPLVFSKLRNQLNVMGENANAYDTALKAAVQKQSLDPARLTALNQTLIRTERSLTRPEGLPNRNWYKHQVYAPGYYTGYGVKTLPGG
jgi:N-acetylated-alpha-linked acidic dipeptidase